MIALQWGDLPCGITRSQKLQGALRFLRKFSQVWCMEGKMHSVSPMRKKACHRFGTRTDLRTWIPICCSPAWWAPSFKRPKEQENKSFSGPHICLVQAGLHLPSLCSKQLISLTSLGTSSTGTDQWGWLRRKSPQLQSCTDLKDPAAWTAPFTFYLRWTTGPDKLRETHSLRPRPCPPLLQQTTSHRLEQLDSPGYQPPNLKFPVCSTLYQCQY